MIFQVFEFSRNIKENSKFVFIPKFFQLHHYEKKYAYLCLYLYLTKFSDLIMVFTMAVKPRVNPTLSTSPLIELDSILFTRRCSE